MVPSKRSPSGLKAAWCQRARILIGKLDSRTTDDWDALIQDFHLQGKEKTAVVDPENGRFLLAKAVAREVVKV